jgi:hypothetical protein
MIAVLTLLQESSVTTDFNDLGKLLLGGVAAAIVVAVALTLVRFKQKDKKPPSSNFISINSQTDKQSD